MKSLTKTVLLGLFVFAFAASAAVMNFDGVTAPCCYNQVTPGGPLGPVVTDGFLSVNGGVILDGASGWAGKQTSSPNVYGTSDFLPLQDSSLLPGKITGTFDGPVTDLSFDIINGHLAASFTVNLYNASHGIIAMVVIPLDAYPGSGAVHHVGFSGYSGIRSFEVLSGQGSGSIDFGIDTIDYTVPEPSTFFLMSAGLLAIPMLRRIRNRGHVR